VGRVYLTRDTATNFRTKMDARYEVIIKAADLARSSPERWSGFLGALSKYTDEKVGQCVSGPPEMVQVLQGRAQACRDLFRELETCVQRADEIAAKRDTNERYRKI
jgi:hypothetical protein